MRDRLYVRVIHVYFDHLGMQSEGNSGVDVWSTVTLETGTADMHIPPMMDADYYGDACSVVAYRGSESISNYTIVKASSAPHNPTASDGAHLLWVNPYGSSSTPPIHSMVNFDATPTGANIVSDSNGTVPAGEYYVSSVLMEIKPTVPPTLTPVRYSDRIYSPSGCVKHPR